MLNCVAVMLRRRLLLALFAALALSAFACGNDDNGDKPSPSASARTATPRVSETPTPNDAKTPGASETPISQETPTASAQTPPPTASQGTPAPLIENVPAFFAQFQTTPQDERMCAYNPSTRAIDCSGRGLYAPAPPPVGQGIDCFLMTVDQAPVAIRCEIVAPQGTTYYDIRPPT